MFTDPPSNFSRRRHRDSGALIINADDWGRDTLNTDRILDCFRVGTVSSVSAMVFMEDSERAASIAHEMTIDAGLHLNLTTSLNKPVNSRLAECQQRLAKYLRGHRLAPVIFHPGLVHCFEYVVSTQLDEFRRLYGSDPIRIDGHHHMHLCANVLMGGLIPEGIIVRRNFSFRPGEKSFANRFWRRIVDSLLARRHRLADFFFSLPPMNPSRLQPIMALASDSVVELETHPVNPEEYAFLISGGIRQSSDPLAYSSFSRCFS